MLGVSSFKECVLRRKKKKKKREKRVNKRIRSDLWNGDKGDVTEGITYSQGVLEQYKLYVELADRVSQRRGIANSFFLLVNSSAVIILGSLGVSFQDASPWLFVFPTVILVCICVVWFYLVRSYSQLNSGKWKVVGALEERLPASPWWRAEWQALGEGKDRSLYWPLTHLEQWVPWIFILLYAGTLAIVLTQV